MKRKCREHVQSPYSVIDYGFDWSEWLQGDDIVVESNWVAYPHDLVINREQIIDGTVTSCFVSQALPASRYKLTNRVTTEQGRVEERYITIYTTYGNEDYVSIPPDPTNPTTPFISLDQSNRLKIGTDGGLYVSDDLIPDPLAYFNLAKG